MCHVYAKNMQNIYEKYIPKMAINMHNMQKIMHNMQKKCKIYAKYICKIYMQNKCKINAK